MPIDCAFKGCNVSDIYITDIGAWCDISGLSALMPYGSKNKKIYLNGIEIKDLVIPNGVTSIGQYAFYGCASLTSVVIPDSVTTIGSQTFSGCNVSEIYITDIGAWCNISGLIELMSYGSKNKKIYLNGIEIKDLVIPNGVTSIDYRAFYGCASLTSVVIPDSVTSIGKDAFYGCTSLTSVTIGNSVTSIGSQAFSGCSVSKIYITDIGAWCDISGLSALMPYGSKNKKIYLNGIEIKDLVIPNGVTSIGQYAFYDCTSLTSVTIGNSVTSIGQTAFRGCTSLTSVTIGNSVTSIGKDAFYGCTSLTSVVIPDSVTSIGQSAFYGCTRLTSVVIPDSVTSIGQNAFSGCNELVYNKYDNALYLGNSSNPYVALIKGKHSLITSCVIHSDTIMIADGAFEYYSAFTSITIPDSVTSIGQTTFRGCTSLTSVTIGNSITEIGGSAFNGCTSLKEVYYTGNEEQWNAITNGGQNYSLYAATRYYYSETEPQGEGNYWHYVDGQIVKW